MQIGFSPKSARMIRKVISSVVLLAFLTNSILPASAQTVFNLPKPGAMVPLSPAFTPVLLKGIKVHPDNPFEFDFIVNSGDGRTASKDKLKDESTKVIRYFLASLTTPEGDLWVNLSPYEKDKIIPKSFGTTEMGRDLLAQDYLLKQITASVIYPEEDLGKKFWDKVYKAAHDRFGTTKLPINTFNKVWIVPGKTVVYENKTTAYITETRLQVMLEEDYLALAQNKSNKEMGLDKIEEKDAKELNSISSQIVREIVIPELEREVNEGKNFSELRQIYHSLIVAYWYKKRLKDSILAKVYVDKNKVEGVDIDDKAESQKIYDQYVAAFKKGVYNYIKKDFDPIEEKTIARQYFSGGVAFKDQFIASMTTFQSTAVPAQPPVDAAINNVQARLNTTQTPPVTDALMSTTRPEGDLSKFVGIFKSSRERGSRVIHGISLYNPYEEGEYDEDDGEEVVSVREVIDHGHDPSVGRQILSFGNAGIVMLDSGIYPNVILGSSGYIMCCGIAIKARNRKTGKIDFGLTHIFPEVDEKNSILTMLRRTQEALEDDGYEVLEYIVNYEDHSSITREKAGRTTQQYEESLSAQFSASYQNVKIQFHSRPHYEEDEVDMAVAHEGMIVKEGNTVRLLDWQLADAPAQPGPADVDVRKGDDKLMTTQPSEIYAKTIPESDRQGFKDLMAQGKLEDAYQLLKQSPVYQAYQFEPRKAVYPGGLDFKLLELFPDIEEAHYINLRPFRVNYNVDDLVYRDPSGGIVTGQDALDAMLKTYLNAAATESFISNGVQEKIVYRYPEDRLKRNELGLPQIGMEPFMIADLERMGATEIKPEEVDAQNHVYAIRFKDIFGHSKTIYYHNANVVEGRFSPLLEDLLGRRDVDLLFSKAWSTAVDFPVKLYGGIKNNGLYVADFTEDVVVSRKSGFHFNFIGVQNVLKAEMSLAGSQSAWGNLGYHDRPLDVFRVVDDAPAQPSPAPSDAEMPGEFRKEYEKLIKGAMLRQLDSALSGRLRLETAGVAEKYLRGFLERHGSLGKEMDAQLADTLVVIGTRTGSFLHPLIAMAKEKGIITEQMRNRIAGAELRWGLNSFSSLLSGRAGEVLYGAMGYTSQAAASSSATVPQPSVIIQWQDGKNFRNRPSITEKYSVAKMLDAQGEKFDFISYLGEALPQMSDFEAGIVTNGSGQNVDSQAEANRKADSWQYFKWHPNDVARRRPVRTIRQNEQTYHVAFLGFKADMSYAFYQILESGAVFRACINVAEFKRTIAEAKSLSDHLADVNVSQAEKDISGILKDINQILVEQGAAEAQEGDELLVFDLLGQRLRANPQQSAQILNRVNQVLRKRWGTETSFISPEANAEQVEAQVHEIKTRVENILNAGKALRAMRAFFTYNEFEWLKSAGENVTIGQIADRPGVSHYPVYTAMSAVSRPIEYRSETPDAHFAYVRVDENLSAALKGRRVLLGQGKTVRELLQDVGIENPDLMKVTRGRSDVSLDEVVEEQQSFGVVAKSRADSAPIPSTPLRASDAEMRAESPSDYTESGARLLDALAGLRTLEKREGGQFDSTASAMRTQPMEEMPFMKALVLSPQTQQIFEEHEHVISGKDPLSNERYFLDPEVRFPALIFLKLGLYMWEQLATQGPDDQGRGIGSKQVTDELQEFLDEWNARNPLVSPHLDVPLLLHLALSAYTDVPEQLNVLTEAYKNIEDQDLRDKMMALDAVMLSWHINKSFSPKIIDAPDLVAIKHCVIYLTGRLKQEMSQDKRQILSRALASILLALSFRTQDIAPLIATGETNLAEIAAALREFGLERINEIIDALIAQEAEAQYPLSAQGFNYSLPFWQFKVEPGQQPTDRLLNFNSPQTQKLFFNLVKILKSYETIFSKSTPQAAAYFDSKVKSKKRLARNFYASWLGTATVGSAVQSGAADAQMDSEVVVIAPEQAGNSRRKELADLPKVVEAAREVIREVLGDQEQSRIVITQAQSPLLITHNASFQNLLRDSIAELLINALEEQPQGIIPVDVLVENGVGVVRIVNTGKFDFDRLREKAREFARHGRFCKIAEGFLVVEDAADIPATSEILDEQAVDNLSNKDLLIVWELTTRGPANGKGKGLKMVRMRAVRDLGGLLRIDSREGKVKISLEFPLATQSTLTPQITDASTMANISLHFNKLLEMLGWMDSRYAVAPQESDLVQKYFKGRKVLNIGLEDIMGVTRPINIVTKLREQGIEAYGVGPDLISSWPTDVFREGLAEKIPWEDGHFDDIVSVNLFEPGYFEHAFLSRYGRPIGDRDYDVIAAQIKRVLKPGGRLYMQNIDAFENQRLNDALKKAGFDFQENDLIAISPSERATPPATDALMVSVVRLVDDSQIPQVSYARVGDVAIAGMNLDNLISEGEITVPPQPRILIMGASAAEVRLLDSQFPGAQIVVIGLNQEPLDEIARYANSTPGLTQRIKVFLADGSRLDPEKNRGDSQQTFRENFSAETYDFVYVNGIDPTAFLGEDRFRGDQIIAGMAEEIMRMLKPDGYLHWGGVAGKSIFSKYQSALREIQNESALIAQKLPAQPGREDVDSEMRPMPVTDAQMITSPQRVELLKKPMNIDEEFAWMLIDAVRETEPGKAIENKLNWETIRDQKAKFADRWLDKPAIFEKSLYLRALKVLKDAGMIVPLLEGQVWNGEWQITQETLAMDQMEAFESLHQRRQEKIKRAMAYHEPASAEEEFAFVLWKGRKEGMEITSAAQYENLKDRLADYWLDEAGYVDEKGYLFRQSESLLQESRIEPSDNDSVAREKIKQASQRKKDLAIQRFRSLEVSETVRLVMERLENKITVPKGFWMDPSNAEQAIIWALDKLEENGQLVFQQARKDGNIKEMARIYREQVKAYKSPDGKVGQVSYFIQIGRLNGLMNNSDRPYLAKSGSPPALLRFALPGLIDEDAEGALRPWEVEPSWKDPRLAKKAVIQALDNWEDFKQARRNNDFKEMAQIYRKRLLGPREDKTGGPTVFFGVENKLNGLLVEPSTFLHKIDSPGELIRFALPGLVDEDAEGLLRPWEIEELWNDERLAKKAVLEVLDKLQLDTAKFSDARRAENIADMARIYRGTVKTYRGQKRNGQVYYFSEIGGLSGLMSVARPFLEERTSPWALLKFAVPSLVDQNNPDALRKEELQSSVGVQTPAQPGREVVDSEMRPMPVTDAQMTTTPDDDLDHAAQIKKYSYWLTFSVEKFIQGLNDEDVDIRWASASGLKFLAEGKLIKAGDIPEVMTALLKGLNDNDVTVRRASVEGLKFLAEGKLIKASDIPSSSITALLKGFNNNDVSLRRASAEGLKFLAEGKIITASDIPSGSITALLDGLKDGNSGVRRESAEGLKFLAEGKLIKAGDIPEVITALLKGLKDDGVFVRRESAEGLKFLAEGKLITASDIPSGSITALFEGLNSGNSDVRLASAEGLKFLAEGKLITASDIPSGSITALLNGLNDKDAGLRLESAEGLKYLAEGKLIKAGDIPEVITALFEGLNDNDAGLRLISAQGLKYLAEGKLIKASDIPSGSITALLNGLNSGNSYVRRASAEGLSLLNLVFEKPLIDFTDITSLKLIFDYQVEGMINNLRSESVNINQLVYAQEYLSGILNQYGSLDVSWDAKLADILVDLGVRSGSYMHPLIALAKEKGIITEQMRNRITGAELRWGINSNRNLLQDIAGEVLYAHMGYTGQSAAVAEGQVMPQPSIAIQWQEEDNPPAGEKYATATMTDARGNRFEFISFLGEAMPGMSDFMSGIEPINGGTPNVPEDKRTADSWQYFKWNDKDVARRRMVRTINSNGKTYHVAFLGFKADMSYALYQVVESGAVFRACINTGNFRATIAEAKRVAEEVDKKRSRAYEESNTVAGRLEMVNVAQAQQELSGIMQDVNEVLTQLPAFETDEYDEKFVEGLRETLKYLVRENFDEEFGIEPLEAVTEDEIIGMDEDDLQKLAMQVIAFFNKGENVKLFKDVSARFMPYVLTWNLLGFRLTADTKNQAQLINQINRILKTRWDDKVTFVSTEASAAQIKTAIEDVRGAIRNIRAAAQLLGTVQGIFSYSQFEWMQIAGERLAIGQVKPSVSKENFIRIFGLAGEAKWEELKERGIIAEDGGIRVQTIEAGAFSPSQREMKEVFENALAWPERVRHHPAFQAMHVVSQSVEYKNDNPTSHFAYVQVDEATSKKLNKGGVAGRRFLLGQGKTVRDLLVDVGIEDVDSVKVNWRSDLYFAARPSGIRPISLDDPLGEQQQFDVTAKSADALMTTTPDNGFDHAAQIKKYSYWLTFSVEKFIQGFNDGNAGVRWASAAGLKSLAEGKLITASDLPSGSITGLLNGLKDDDVDVRQESAEGLKFLAEGKLITASDIPSGSITRLLDGLNNYVRRKSAAGLKFLAEGKLITASDIRKVMTALLNGLKDDDVEVLLASAEGLKFLAEGKLITASDIPSGSITVLLKRLEDKDEDVRWASAEGLKFLVEGKLITASDIQRVITALLYGLNVAGVGVRRASAAGLKSLAEGKLIAASDIRKVMKALLNRLYDMDLDVRRESAEGLKFLAGGELITVSDIPLGSITGLLNGLNNEDIYVRRESAAGLKFLAGGELITASDIPSGSITGLLNGLKDGNSGVRRESAAGLKFLAEGKLITASDIPSGSIKALLNGLKDGHDSVRQESAEGLKFLAEGKLITASDIPSGSIKALLKGLKDDDVDVLRASAKGLKFLAEGKLITASDIPSGSITRLLNGLNNDDVDVRFKLAEGLRLLNLVFEKPLIDITDMTFLKLIFDYQVEGMINNLRNGSNNINQLAYAQEYLSGILNQYGSLGVSWDAKLADILVDVGVRSGSYLHPLIALAKAKGIITEQMRNRIAGAELRWGINSQSANLINGQAGSVLYSHMGFSAQSAALAEGTSAPSPSISIKWEDEKSGQFSNRPSRTAKYSRGEMVDAKRNSFSFISYLGEPMPGMQDFTPGIVRKNGDASTVPEANRIADSWQYFKWDDKDVPRRRSVRTIKHQGNTYHVAFLGFKADMSYALYQVIESGAIFRACINVADFKRTVAEAKSLSDHLEEIDLARGEKEVAEIIKEINAVLAAGEEIESPRYEKQFIDGLRQTLIYLLDEGFATEFGLSALTGLSKDGIEGAEEDDVIGIAQKVLVDLANRPQETDLLKRVAAVHLPSLLTFDLLGVRLTADTEQSAKILNRVNRILRERWGTETGFISTEASHVQVKAKIAELKAKVDNIFNAGKLLQAMGPFFTFNEVEWLKLAGENVAIGQVPESSDVAHYPAYVAMSALSRPVEYRSEAPNTQFAYVIVDKALSRQLPPAIRGRLLLLGQAETVEGLLADVGITQTEGMVIKRNNRVVNGDSKVVEQEKYQVSSSRIKEVSTQSVQGDDAAMTSDDKQTALVGKQGTYRALELTEDAIRVGLGQVKSNGGIFVKYQDRKGQEQTLETTLQEFDVLEGMLSVTLALGGKKIFILPWEQERIGAFDGRLLALGVADAIISAEDALKAKKVFDDGMESLEEMLRLEGMSDGWEDVYQHFVNSMSPASKDLFLDQQYSSMTWGQYNDNRPLSSMLALMIFVLDQIHLGNQAFLSDEVFSKIEAMTALYNASPAYQMYASKEMPLWLDLPLLSHLSLAEHTSKLSQMRLLSDAIYRLPAGPRMDKIAAIDLMLMGVHFNGDLRYSDEVDLILIVEPIKYAVSRIKLNPQATETRMLRVALASLLVSMAKREEEINELFRRNTKLGVSISEALQPLGEALADEIITEFMDQERAVVYPISTGKMSYSREFFRLQTLGRTGSEILLNYESKFSQTEIPRNINQWSMFTVTANGRDLSIWEKAAKINTKKLIAYAPAADAQMKTDAEGVVSGTNVRYADTGFGDSVHGWYISTEDINRLIKGLSAIEPARGVFVGVGSFHNLDIGLALDAQGIVLIDHDKAIADLNFELLKIIETTDDFGGLLARVEKFLVESVPGIFGQGAFMSFVHEGLEQPAPYKLLRRTPLVWAKNEVQFKKLKDLIRQGKVLVVHGDVLSEESMQHVGVAVQAMNAPVAWINLSNVETAEAVSYKRRQSLLKLPGALRKMGATDETFVIASPAARRIPDLVKRFPDSLQVLNSADDPSVYSPLDLRPVVRRVKSMKPGDNLFRKEVEVSGVLTDVPADFWMDMTIKIDDQPVKIATLERFNVGGQEFQGHYGDFTRMFDAGTIKIGDQVTLIGGQDLGFGAGSDTADAQMTTDGEIKGIVRNRLTPMFGMGAERARMLESAKTGGIDFTAGKMNVEIRGDGAPIEFNFDPAQIETLQFDGFVPIIINITPVTNLPLFLSEGNTADPATQVSMVN